MSQSLQQIDESLFRLINGETSGEAILVPLMAMASSTYFWLIFGVCVVGGLVYYKPKIVRKVVLLITLTLGLTDLFTYRVLKVFFGRERPCFALDDVVLRVSSCGGTLGFPSNHAANAMALTLVLLLFFADSRKYYALLAVPLLVGLSRVYLGVHYPADVLAGFLVGAGLSFLIYFILQRLSIFKSML